jgi:hypothetical protein
MSIRRLRNHFIRTLGLLADSLASMFAKLKPETQVMGTQRMCPFCGLITPRAKGKCLECGKSFGQVALKPKAAK